MLDVTKSRPHLWVQSVIRLLDVAIGELGRQDNPAKYTVAQALTLLREQSGSGARSPSGEEGGRMAAWQARKVREYIDAHLDTTIRVEDLCGLIRRSEAHFARCFKRTFGVSPHAFIVLRRLEFAARIMLETDSSLSEIALRCGFADQAHLCKHFREATGRTPAAWRRAHKFGDEGQGSYYRPRPAAPCFQQII